MNTPDLHDSPYIQKRGGNYERAFTKYAEEYAAAMVRQHLAIQKLLFDQLFDLQLIAALKEGRQFHDADELLRAIAEAIRDELTNLDAYDDAEFYLLFEDCRQRFLPKGRQKNPFSVDKEWLISKKASRTQQKAV